MYLVINPGSSSLKATVYPQDSAEALLSVSIEDIGTATAHLIPAGTYGTDAVETIQAETHLEAAQHLHAWLSARTENLNLEAIGYRIVHGGERLKEATMLDAAAIQYLKEITPLAPNHMPAALQCITAFQEIFSDVKHIGCFDTAFFSDVPEKAQTLPLPLNIREQHIKRYGFHGLSYQYLLSSLEKHEGTAAAHGRVIMLHLGSGASLTACVGKKPIDMSMGFTPVSGIMMSTRTGNLEPGVMTYMQEQLHLGPDDISDIVTYQSGLLGISGYSADMLTLLQDQNTTPSARLAIDMFCYDIKKTLGGYIAALGGVDTIVFAGGIGERSAEIRARILSDLAFLGILVDEERNQRNERLISADGSKVGVHVIPTHEDETIYTQMKRF